MKKVIAIVVAVILLVLAGFALITMGDRGGAVVDSTDETAIVIVDGEIITQSEYDVFLAQVAAEQGVDVSTLDEATLAQLRVQVIDALISGRLLQQAAEEAGVEATDEAVETQLTQLKSQFPDEAAYEEELVAQGLTEEDLRTNIRQDMEVQTYLDEILNFNSITVTDEEVAEAYVEISANEDVPPLEEISAQLESLLIQQKQQVVVAEHLAELRAAADVEVR
jgi:peptidyl-prolyl cis-trans isomerase SurA